MSGRYNYVEMCECVDMDMCGHMWSMCGHVIGKVVIWSYGLEEY